MSASNSTPMALEKLRKVEQILAQESKGSWELGTEQQALLELHCPHLTPFHPSYNSNTLRSLSRNDVPARILSIASEVIQERSTDKTLPGKGKVLLQDGSVGDAGSLVIGCLVAAGASEGEQRDSYLTALEEQICYFTDDALNTEFGALSHQYSHLTLWADFTYMCPPAVALYAIHTCSPFLLHWSYYQCALQRQCLINLDTGLWKHVLNLESDEYPGEKVDLGCWATSNGWAAAGMLRVLVMIVRAEGEGWIEEISKEKDDLLLWVKKIMDGVILRVSPNGMIRNYIDEKDSFEESCGTALLASVAYRLAQLSLSNDYLSFAHLARQRILTLITDEGVLTGVCDIHDERKQRDVSAEGQAFVLMLEAAWRDWSEIRSLPL